MLKLVFLADVDQAESPKTRESIIKEVVADYADKLQSKENLPPPVVFQADGEKFYRVADGMHRIAAHKKIARKALQCDVRRGGYDECLKFALSSNRSHGLRRSQMDKQTCARAAILQWPDKSNRELGMLVGVDDHTIQSVRVILENAGKLKPMEVRIGVDGVEQPAAKPKTEAKPKPREPAAPKPPPVPKDKTGFPLTKDALRFWDRSPEVEELLMAVSIVKNQIEKAKKNEDLLFVEVSNGVLADLEKAHTTIKTALPYAVCPDCQGHPSAMAKSCVLCKGRGVISEFRWHTVAEEKRKLRAMAVKE